MKKAIVTGANGFVGTWLIKELISQGVQVITVVRSTESDIKTLMQFENVRIVVCPLAEISNLPLLISDTDIDVFYHFAWTGVGGSSRSNYEMQLLNAKFACDAAVVAKKLNCMKFLCAGTITEKIAENVLNINVKAENMIYGVSKHTTHCILDILCKNVGIDYVWMRLSNIYGPFNTTGNIASYTLNEFRNGNTPTFSSGEQPYDLMYVEDAAKAIYLLGQCQTNENCYFIGSGTPKYLKDYLIEMCNIYGEGAQIA